MNYYELSLYFNCDKDQRDIVLAWLSILPFESFEFTDSGLNAYIQENELNYTDVEEVIRNIPFSIKYDQHLVKRINWNEEWEKNFKPILINKDCIVRAPFHKAPMGIKYDIQIMPKMSFGTGHHATTTLMIRSMMDEPMINLRVLDAGCGTGILSIMAEKLQAQSVLAYDIDEWAVINAKENIDLNNCENIDVEKGSSEDIGAHGFDVILANINKNVLLRDIPRFSLKLKMGGNMLLSGFYEDDCSDIIELAELNQLKKAYTATLDKWALIKLEKLV